MQSARELTDHGQERRQQLLDCAAKLFAERGFRSTRIADICSEAGVAKGLFYWYFENKEALFADLVRQMRSRLRKEQLAAAALGDSPISRISHAAQASVRFMAVNSAYFNVIDAVAAGDIPVATMLREWRAVHTDDTEREIKLAQAAGLIDPVLDARLLALGTVGAVVQFSSFHRAGLVEATIDELAAFAGRWVVQALSASSAAS